MSKNFFFFRQFSFDQGVFKKHQNKTRREKNLASVVLEGRKNLSFTLLSLNPSEMFSSDRSGTLTMKVTVSSSWW